MATIASLDIALGANSATLKKDLAKADKTTKRFAKRQKDHFKEISASVKGLGAALAGAFAGRGIGNMVNAAAEIDNLARVAGTGTKEFQKLAHASKTVGVSQEKLSDILKDVNDKFGDFAATGAGPLADFFEQIAPKIGVTAKEFRNLSGPQALQKFITSLEKANLNQQEMTFFMEALASDATALLPLFRNNGQAIRELSKDAAVLSDANIKAAKDMQTAMSLISSNVKNAIATALLPFVEALVPVAEAMGEFAKNNPLVVQAVAGIGAITVAVVALSAAMSALALISGPVLVAVGTIAAIGAAVVVVTVAIKKLIKETGSVGNAFYYMGQRVLIEVRAIGGYFDALEIFIHDVFKNIVTYVKDDFRLTGLVVKKWVAQVVVKFHEFKDVADHVTGLLPTIFRRAWNRVMLSVQKFRVDAQLILSRFLDFFRSLSVSGIQDIFINVWDRLTTTIAVWIAGAKVKFEKFKTWMDENIFSWFTTGFDMIKDAINIDLDGKVTFNTDAIKDTVANVGQAVGQGAQEILSLVTGSNEFEVPEEVRRQATAQALQDVFGQHAHPDLQGLPSSPFAAVENLDAALKANFATAEALEQQAMDIIIQSGFNDDIINNDPTLRDIMAQRNKIDAQSRDIAELKEIFQADDFSVVSISEEDKQALFKYANRVAAHMGTDTQDLLEDTYKAAMNQAELDYLTSIGIEANSFAPAIRAPHYDTAIGPEFVSEAQREYAEALKAQAKAAEKSIAFEIEASAETLKLLQDRRDLKEAHKTAEAALLKEVANDAKQGIVDSETTKAARAALDKLTGEVESFQYTELIPALLKLKENIDLVDKQRRRDILLLLTELGLNPQYEYATGPAGQSASGDPMPTFSKLSIPEIPKSEPFNFDFGTGGGGGQAQEQDPFQQLKDQFETSFANIFKGNGFKGFFDDMADMLSNTIIDSFTEGFLEKLMGKDGFMGKFFESITTGQMDLGRSVASMDGIGSFFGGIGTAIGGFFGFSEGGMVPKTTYSQIGRDSVPAMLTPGEMVVPVDEVDNFGKGSAVVNLNITGDISRQTKREIIEMIPTIATGVNAVNREQGRR